METNVEIIKNHNYISRKFTVSDFSNLFRVRYQALKNLLFNRAEARNAISINYTKNRTEKGGVTIIAMINNITKLPTGTFRLTLEDMSGTITAIISKKNENFEELANFLCLDEVLAFNGVCIKNIFFINHIVYPDISPKSITYSKDDVCVAFTGDLHAGSNKFLPEKLQKFIDWLNEREGNERQKELARKTKYIFVLGDIVDGVGIYPEQYKEQYITDIYEQYHKAHEFLSQIPESKQIIIQGGNHDAIRIAEPQPVLSKKYAKELWELKNVKMVSNPAVVRVHKQNGFEGLKVLMYHGYSFNYYLNNINGLRLAGGYERPDKVIEYLLKHRHLAPAYGSTLALPMKEDPLMIYEVPDVLASGHLHKATIARYKSTFMISASCWQNNTSFQDKVGLRAEPAKVPVLNLKTGKAVMLDFN